MSDNIERQPAVFSQLRNNISEIYNNPDSEKKTCLPCLSDIQLLLIIEIVKFFTDATSDFVERVCFEPDPDPASEARPDPDPASEARPDPDQV